MFKKLRNRFLMLNMIMISVLLIGSFTVVFTITYNNISREADIRLERGISSLRLNSIDSDFPKHGGNNTDPGFLPNRPPNNRNMPETPEIPNDDNRRDFSPMPNESSAIKINSEFDIVETRSPYEFSREFYNEFINNSVQKLTEAADKNTNIFETSHIMKYDDSYWKYKIASTLKDKPNNDDTAYYISILNIDTQMQMLTKLIITLILVLLIALIIVFLICLYFANKSIKPIKDAWDKQNQFIADASHELKTPLTTINTNIDVLLAHSSNTINDEKKWLIYIKDEAERMSKLTNDLLYLAKMDYSAENNLIKTELSLSSTVQSVLLTMEAVIYEKNILLTDDIEDGIKINGDPAQIKQLLMILLDNAVKYTGGERKINVTLKAKDKYAVLSVRNSGDGIPPNDAEKIFDRFYRSDKSRSRNSGGYGLGLAIAKSIVTSHGGTIKLNTKPDEYTEFIIKYDRSL